MILCSIEFVIPAKAVIQNFIMYVKRHADECQHRSVVLCCVILSEAKDLVCALVENDTYVKFPAPLRSF